MKISRSIVVLTIASTTVLAYEMEDPCICPAIYDPICASDGNTYGNKCTFDCHNKNGCWTIVAKGTCEAHNCFRACPHPPLYVCGSDGQTYGSKCAMDCSMLNTPGKAKVTVAHEGKCKQMRVAPGRVARAEEGCFCIQDYDPVCGTDCKTYSNACTLGCAAKLNRDLKIQHKGECDSGTFL